MKLRAQFPGRSYLLFLLALIIPCILAAVPAILAVYGKEELSQAFEWVSHTSKVQREIEQAEVALLDAETGQRGFLLTGNRSYSEPALAAAEQMSREVTALRALTADNTTQRKELEKLEPHLASRIDLIKQTIALRTNGRNEEAMALVMNGRGKTEMDAVRAGLDRMAAEENRLLSVRTARLEEMAHKATLLMFALALLTALFALTIFVMLRRILRLQGLVTICAWSRTVEYEGKWLSFEEYLLQRFNISTSHGISPSEMERVFSSLPEEERGKENDE
jgi:CHASE3 domain sensor protein